MMPAKEEVRRILEKLPENATLEDIQYHIYMRQQIERGVVEDLSQRALAEDEFDVKMSSFDS
jgi:hypothetical protein